MWWNIIAFILGGLCGVVGMAILAAGGCADCRLGYFHRTGQIHGELGQYDDANAA